MEKAEKQNVLAVLHRSGEVKDRLVRFSEVLSAHHSSHPPPAVPPISLYLSFSNLTTHSPLSPHFSVYISDAFAPVCREPRRWLVASRLHTCGHSTVAQRAETGGLQGVLVYEFSLLRAKHSSVILRTTVVELFCM